MEEKSLAKIREFAQGEKDIVALYLFGSKAAGVDAKYSDTDIGVLFSKELTKDERFDLKLSLIGNIAKILRSDNIDIVNMIDAPPFLRFEVIKGSLLYTKDKQETADFEKRTYEEYFDRLFYLKRYTEEKLKMLTYEYGV